MGSLLAYSGITTKVRAMESHFISEEQFREMAALESVSEAVEFLKKMPAYQDIFTDTDDAFLHRGKIEQLLNLSQYKDFAKLYRFSNLSQRKFLDLYFMHYEITILKKCLRTVLDRSNNPMDLSLFQEFFDKHSKIDLIKLSNSESLEEFIFNLNGSPYYDLLTHLKDTESPTMFDYELSMDLLYFKTLWKVKSKFLSKSEQAILAQCFGTNLDMLNIQWIYRSKKYYRLPPADIYSLLIPVQYRLSKEDINKLVETATTEEFFALLPNTYYGELPVANLAENPRLEDLYEKVLNRIYSITSQRNPYSIAVLNSYLYFKEEEIHKIITVIESIRYGVDTDEIISYVITK